MLSASVDMLGAADGVLSGVTMRSDGQLHVERKDSIFCHQPPSKMGCAAHGKQIQNLGWASRTGDRNTYGCRNCGSKWSRVTLYL